MKAAAPALLLLVLSACHPNLGDFRRTLESRDSATLALEGWCARLDIANPARIEATTLDDATPVTPAIRATLQVGADEPVRVRHVQLSCGGTVMSDARNWYVPGRLTPEMNHILDTTRVPFGRVVAPIGLHRRAFPEHSPSPAPCPAGSILHNTAVLLRDDGRAYSLVSECYTRANLHPH
jgi:hypothetical protein